MTHSPKTTPLTSEALLNEAVKRLSRREYSRHELYQRLLPLCEDKQQLCSVLNELSARGWQSDQRFAEQFNRHKGRQYGRRRLVYELQQRGLKDEVIAHVLSNKDEFADAQHQWQKKFGQLPKGKQEILHQIRFLSQRGFSMESIRQILLNSDALNDETTL